MDLFKRVVLAFFCCQTRKFLNKVKYKIRKRDGELWDHSRQTGIHHCNQSHEQRATNELVIGCEGNEADLDNGEPFQSKSHQNLYPSTIVSLNAFYQQECASNLSNYTELSCPGCWDSKRNEYFAYFAFIVRPFESSSDLERASNRQRQRL